MRISFAICTHNEGQYVATLLTSLLKFIEGPGTQTGDEYEIVIVDDYSDEKVTVEALEFALHHWSVRVYKHALNNDFAAHKNYLIEQCTGEWILNLDADEVMPEDFLMNMTAIIESNPLVEAYWLPRVNTVDGLTRRHVQKWGWTLTTLPGFRIASNLDPKSGEYELLKEYGFILHEANGFVTYDQPIICWPDPQMRLFKRSPKIRWVGKVHETLTGFENYSLMPYEPDFAIRHHKEIARQEAQNNLYDTIQR